MGSRKLRAPLVAPGKCRPASTCSANPLTPGLAFPTPWLHPIDAIRPPYIYLCIKIPARFCSNAVPGPLTVPGGLTSLPGSPQSPGLGSNADHRGAAQPGPTNVPNERTAERAPCEPRERRPLLRRDLVAPWAQINNKNEEIKAWQACLHRGLSGRSGRSPPWLPACPRSCP